MSGAPPVSRALRPDTIAAIVPTVDRAGPLERCLMALAASTTPYHEVVVVDQGGHPAVAAVAGAHGARRLALGRRGLSHARNRGIASVESEWCFFPDDDCIPDPAFAGDVLRHARQHPELRILCGTVCDEHHVPLAPAMGARVEPILGTRSLMRTIVSAGLVVHRSVFERLGGFDEQLGLGARFPSGEESDLVRRALRARMPVAYVPTAPVLHAEPFSAITPAQRVERAYQYGRGWGAFFAKHGVRDFSPGVLALFAEYLARAAGGAVLTAVQGRADAARRYAASLRGRWSGFVEYLGTPTAATPAAAEHDRC